MKKTKNRFIRLLAALAAAAFVFGSAAALAAEPTAVTVSGVTIANKTYDGQAVVPSGAPVAYDGATPVSVPAGDFTYLYESTDGAGYSSSAAPKNAGAYRLTISVSNASYAGASEPIAFTISKAALTIHPDAGKTRYVGLPNPTFTYSASGAVSGETPAFAGALSGAADADAAAGTYAITLGTLTAADSGAFLADNYSLAVASGSTYSVVSYATSAVATLSATNLGENSIYTGDVTLLAPDGYTIALTLGASSWGASATKTDCTPGLNSIGYYLRVSTGDDAGAISEQKAIQANYDAVSPAVTLYSPAASSTDAAAGANQKIILSVNEKVFAVSGQSVTLAQTGGSTYTASAASATLLGGDTGLWYLVFDLGDFVNGSTPLAALAAGATYTVSAPAGAYKDAAGNLCGVLSAQFATIADASGTAAVVFTGANALLTVRTDASVDVHSGQALPIGTKLVFTAPAESGYVVQKQVFVGGVETTSADLSNYTLAGDLAVFYSRVSGAFTGTARIIGAARAGVTLTGTVDSPNQSDASKWTLTWYRVDGGTATLLGSGDSAYGWTLSALDIGKTIRLDVTDETLTGTLSVTSGVVAKADYTGSTPAAPTTASVSETSVTLTAVSGYEYSQGGSTWQASPSFTGLTSGQSYEFFQRVAATDAVSASPSSPGKTVTLYGPLSGTVAFSTAAQSGVKLTVSLSGTNDTDHLVFTWKRDGSAFLAAKEYTPTASDIGKILTVEVTSTTQTGTKTGSTAAVLRAVCSKPTPSAPTLASATSTSITLNATDGNEYSLGGSSWQATTTFHDLTPGQTYSFYQRVKQTDTELASGTSLAGSLTTLPALAGTIMTSGEARYGMTILASFTSGTSESVGTLTYTWKRGTITVGTGASYVVAAIDIGNPLSLEVTSSRLSGTVTRALGTVAKAYYSGETPAAPTRYSRTSSKIVLNAVSGCEYSRSGTAWQDSTTFSGLKAGTTYTFYQRYKATTTTEASPASAALKTATSSSSSGGDSTSATPTPAPDDSEGTATALYTLTLTSDNTRVLYSVLRSLAEGNKTKDVTIKQPNVEFTFAKGVMNGSYTKMWYDFGVSINNSIVEQTAKSIAGDAYVATVHYNFDGELPGKATIRLWLGAAHAGKTLYYYKLEDDKTLTFMQTATADSTGWVSVTQTSCSDYVFLNRDIQSAAATPSPAVSPTASSSAPSPTPTPLIAADDKPLAGLSAEGWLVAAIVLLAVALIVGGIWLYTKNRDEE